MVDGFKNGPLSFVVVCDIKGSSCIKTLHVHFVTSAFITILIGLYATVAAPRHHDHENTKLQRGWEFIFNLDV